MVIVFIGLLTIGFLLIAAIVVDLSYVRLTRQQNRSAADLAVAAGMQGMQNDSGAPRSWGAVCEALTYLRANKASLSALTGTFTDGAGNVLSDPCASPTVDPYTRFCDGAVPTTWARFNGTAAGGTITVQIKSAYQMPDPAFPEDIGIHAGDNGVASLGGCDQVAVIVSQTDGVFFGGVAGRSSYETTTRSVGRVIIGEVTPNAVALLLLEQTSCSTLVTGGSNTFVRVRAVPVGAPTRPGRIHSNSNASGSDCTGSARTVEGSSACSAVNNCLSAGPSVVAEGVGPAALGILSIRASTLNPSFSNTTACADPVAPTPGCTVSPLAVNQGIVTRAPVDNRYLARARAAKTLAQSTLAGAASNPSFFQVSGSGACNGLRNMTISATTPASASVVNTGGRPGVFLNCDFDTGNNPVIFDSTITDVAVNGSLSVGSNGSLRLDSVRRLYVAGNGATGIVSGGGVLYVNGGSTPTNCTDRQAAAPSLVTRVVVLTGGLAGGSSAAVHLCNSFVLLADGTLPSTVGTAPSTNSFNSTLSFGSQNTVDWKAPNQSNAALPNIDPLYDSFEDMALWTEYSGNCSNSGPQIGGQGAVVATGVFFLPNACPFGLSGGGVGADINSDAQFIVRRLVMSGTVHLTMAPNPANVVPVPAFESTSLVR